MVSAMGETSRVEECRKQALFAETKAFNARSEDTRRAWLIIARDWTKMAERAETVAATETALASLAAQR